MEKKWLYLILGAGLTGLTVGIFYLYKTKINVCKVSDFIRSDERFDVSDYLAYCGLDGSWVLSIFYSRPTKVEKYGPTQPPERDECTQIVPGWRKGYDIERRFCSKDNNWYLVTYPAKLEKYAEADEEDEG